MRCGRWKNAFGRQKRRFNAEVQSSQKKTDVFTEIPRRPRCKMAAAGFLFILAAIKRVANGERLRENPMATFSRVIFEAVKWRARPGLNAEADSLSDVKQDARQRGVRGETFAYWYLRRHGYFSWRGIMCRET